MLASWTFRVLTIIGTKFYFRELEEILCQTSIFADRVLRDRDQSDAREFARPLMKNMFECPCYSYYIRLRRQRVGEPQVVRTATFGRDVTVTYVTVAASMAENDEASPITLRFKVSRGGFICLRIV